MKKLRAILIDDEPLACLRLEQLLAGIDRVEIISRALNGLEALEQIRTLAPDLIFLDIQMPGLNGFEVLQHLRQVPLVIFTTAYDQYALQAFETLAVDYLLKPIRPEQLQKAVEKIDRMDRVLAGASTEKAAAAQYLTRFVLKAGTRYTIVSQEEVVLFYAKDKYTYLRSGGRDRIIDLTLQELERKIDPALFLRCHRSFIIAAGRVARLESLGSRRRRIIMTDGTEVVSSRSYADGLKQAFPL